MVQKDGTRIPNPDIKGLEIEFLGKGALVEIGEGCRFTNTKFICGPEVKIKLAEEVLVCEKLFIWAAAARSEVSIGRGTSLGVVTLHLRWEKEHYIHIGEDCMFGWDITFRMSDGHAILDSTTRQVLNKGGNIVIGNHVWVGTQVLFLKHSSVGNNSVVGARSLVTKTFSEDNVIIAGTPARVIRRGTDWVRETVDQYLWENRNILKKF